MRVFIYELANGKYSKVGSAEMKGGKVVIEGEKYIERVLEQGIRDEKGNELKPKDKEKFIDALPMAFKGGYIKAVRVDDKNKNEEVEKK